MKCVQSIAFVLLALWFVPGTEGEWRSTSVKKELNGLKTIFANTLEKYDEVLASVAQNCEPCADECEPTCITKQLKKFQERLQRLLSVIAKLEKLACHDCPGEYWTDSVKKIIGLPDPAAPPGPAPSIRKKHLDDSKIRNLSPGTMKNQLYGLMGNLKSVMVATKGHMFRELPESKSSLDGNPRAITFDPSTGNVFAAVELADGAVSITRRSSSSGDINKEVKTYAENGHQPVDLAMYGKKLVVLLTNQTHSSLEVISISMGTSTVKTTFPGAGRRLTVDKQTSVVYYTSSTGIYTYNLRVDNGVPVAIANNTNAVGIAFDSTGKRLFYCYSDNGDITAYNPSTGDATAETKNNIGCSDMALHYVKDIFGGQPLQGTSILHLYVVSDTRNEVTEYLPGNANGMPRMQSQFTSEGGTSITLITG